MASSNKTVTVLTPNGRRQNVKVTPNSTILQVLEEVCKKQGFKAEEYDLKHHNNVLDVSSIIRFSGLPNNAMLEMCPIQKLRAETPVTLGLQLENGNRITGNYAPNENLWNILTNLCPNEVKIEDNPVVIYMRVEVSGIDALKSTTLKSLGLSGGRAMLRLLHRKPEQLRTQANVSSPLPSKPVEEKPYIRKLQRIEPEASENVPKPEPVPLKNDAYEPKIESQNTEPRESISPPKETKKSNFVTDFVKKEKSKNKTTDPQKIKSSKSAGQEIKEEEDKMEEIVFLGERNALAFSLDMAQTVPTELPDEFFDLTVKDARRLLKDLKQKRIELEETPLQTAAHKNLEQNKKILRNLNQYKKSVIRVQFPDRTVLQGTFKPLETIQNVKEFVTGFLEDSRSGFHLYTTPPKSVLQTESTLLDADCVPSALIHFGVDFPVKDDQKFLKQALISQFTSPNVASLAAAKARGDRERLEKNEAEESDMSGITEISTAMEVDEDRNKEIQHEEVNIGASTSNAPSTSCVKEEKKVPKWFKPSK